MSRINYNPITKKEIKFKRLVKMGDIIKFDIGKRKECILDVTRVKMKKDIEYHYCSSVIDRIDDDIIVYGVILNPTEDDDNSEVSFYVNNIYNIKYVSKANRVPLCKRILLTLIEEKTNFIRDLIEWKNDLINCIKPNDSEYW